MEPFPQEIEISNVYIQSPKLSRIDFLNQQRLEGHVTDTDTNIIVYSFLNDVTKEIFFIFPKSKKINILKLDDISTLKSGIIKNISYDKNE